MFLHFCSLNVHLHDGVGGKDSFLDRGVTRGAADCGKVTHGILSRNSFASPRLTAHYDRLVSLIPVLKCEGDNMQKNS